MAVDELNNAGMTVAGSRVTFKLVSEDDQADPRIGVQVAQKLVDAKVAAVLGPYNSGVAIPASRLYHGAGIPMLSVASNPALTLQGFDEVFRIGASDGQLGGAMEISPSTRLKRRPRPSLTIVLPTAKASPKSS